MEESRKPTLMQMQFSLPMKIMMTAVIMIALILFVFWFKVPNPNMILIAGLVLCSALFGVGGGAAASVIMLGYTLYFFSTDHSFTRFTPENIQKVWVSLIGIGADMALVCWLKHTEIQAFKQVDKLTAQLQKENQKLEHLSKIDALTGIRNRTALHQDSDVYVGHEAVVMMMDLDDFKIINDTGGHEEGDRILKETGKLLADAFGREHCYRYGGDEFLIIAPDLTVAEFNDRLGRMMKAKPVCKNGTSVGYSVGYAHAVVKDPDTLQDLIAAADERLYEAKRDKKRMTALKDPEEEAEVTASEYSPEEMKAFLNEMSQKYDLARVVDPIECRIIDIQDDGSINMNKKCYDIWNAEHKCINCSSALACRTGCNESKAEHFEENVYLIQSNPVTIRLANGTSYEAVVELVNVEKESDFAANDREAENVGTRAVNYRASHDSLTNVLNAEAFYERARELLEKSPDVTWVMITSNIMNFRLVNTLFGIVKGNEVLVKTSRLLQEISDHRIGICGRIGGDQFAVLIPKAMYREEILNRVANILAETYRSGMFTFCIHFGVYEVDDPSIPVSVMCGRANSALRTIREDLTRTVACFDQEILKKLLKEQRIIGGFEQALKEGQFIIYLQPLTERNGRVIGAEALARWLRPDGTVLMPGEFIETLENAGLIHQLDMHIWELAVKQLSLWKETEYRDMTISVNVSAKDFYSIDIYETLTALVEKYEVDSSKLRIEITETALLVEPDKSDSVVAGLRDKGFLVEIDDFGKGYSSLSLLKNIKADLLKIDMGFLQEIRDRERSRIILKSVIEMAESLGMDVITEGVETQEQLTMLKEMGCEVFQGYYFSRPVPIHDFEAYVLNNRNQ